MTITKTVKSALFALACTVYLTTGVANAAVGPNLISNGSFESNVVNNLHGYSTLGSTTGGLQNWTINSGNIDLIGTFWNAQDGKQSLDLNGSAANGVISQAFATTVGQEYEVTFWMAGNPGDSNKLKSLMVSAAGVSESFQFNATGKTNSNMGWTQEAFTFVASDSHSTLTFASTQSLNPNGSASTFGPALDNVFVTAVPEPETYAMLLVGLGLVCAAVKRRKAKQA